LPVPRERSDDAWFAPLAKLDLPSHTKFYLGCVHPGDAAGNAAKLAQAEHYVDVAGVGSECGWGRGDTEALAGILDAHESLARRMAS